MASPTTLMSAQPGSVPVAQGFPDCRTVPYRCSPNTADDIIYAFLITSLFVYFIGTFFLLRRSFVYLRTKPYNQMRMANQHLRINVRTLPTGRKPNCSPVSTDLSICCCRMLSRRRRGCNIV